MDLPRNGDPLALARLRRLSALSRLKGGPTGTGAGEGADRQAPKGPLRGRELSNVQKHYLQKLINLCMKHGKKNKSYKIIVLRTLCRLSIFKCPSQGLILLMNAIENVKPLIEVKKVRISGTTQLVPCFASKNRQISLAIRWIIEAALLRRNTKKSMTLDQCLFAELIDASKNIGTVRKRRDDLHKLAESNRGFAHYRWW